MKQFKTILMAAAMLVSGVAALVGSAEVQAQEVRSYFVTDAVGSPVMATDAYANVTWSEDYLPYGERRNHSASSGANERWFTSAPQNEDTGLVDLGNRQYDPVIGRFLGIDPVGTSPEQPFSVNRYAYANNNPYKFIDPDGREVRLQWHEVALGDYHSLVRITPENQARYKNDSRFTSIDSKGRRFATMGAGPVNRKLVSDFNRKSDAAPHEGGLLVNPPKKVSEDEFIDKLIRIDAKYADNLDYDLFPANQQEQKWWRADDGYNSNSYVSGLLGASGGGFKKPPVSTPGWEKPVPKKDFGD